MDLEFTINNQTCRIKDKRQQVVNLSENYLALKFTFSNDWSSTGKFVLYPMEDGTVLRQGINNNKTVVPADVLTGDKFYFTVYGVNNNERITTNLVKVNLLKSGYTDDAVTPGEDELTPSVVEEIYIALEEKVNKETNKGLSSNDFTDQYKSLIDKSTTLKIGAIDQTSTRDQFTATIPDLTITKRTIIGLMNNKGYNNDNATLNVNNVEKPIYVGNAPIRMYEWAFGRIGLFVYVTWTSINSGNGAWVLLNPYNSGG